MKDYVFTLKLRLPPGLSGEEAVERLGAAGCTDALAGIGLAGRLALEFTREADDARGAISSAVDDVLDALPGAEICEVGPDFAGLTDMADLLGLSRQAMRKYQLAYPDFPAPVHDGSTAIWHFCDVLDWLAQSRGKALDPLLVEMAHAARDANFTRESLRHKGRLSA